MKTRLSLALAVLLFASGALLIANDIKSVIITGGTSNTIDVSNEEVLRVRSFTQTGGTTRGLVTVTPDSGDPADVLAAAIIDPSSSSNLEVINSVTIALKQHASVEVTCPSGATCFVSYRKEKAE
jgi:hypothetical protein